MHSAVVRQVQSAVELFSSWFAAASVAGFCAVLELSRGPSCVDGNASCARGRPRSVGPTTTHAGCSTRPRLGLVSARPRSRRMHRSSHTTLPLTALSLIWRAP